MSNTANLLKGIVYGGLIALVACASMADASAKASLPDMTATLREQRVESASVAVIRNGRIVSTGAWGMAGPGRAATVATPYNLASLTKPLTAEVILRLVSAGKLSLDEPMDRYWSDPDLSRDPRRLKLTVRMALSHRTGLPNWRDAKGLAFVHDPGTITGYSGEGYQYAARYAERRTGQPFETLAGRSLFAPVHMRASGYVSAQNETVPIAVPYDEAGKSLPVERVTRYNAADLAHATARDYARFLINARNDRGLIASVAAERSKSQADLTPELCVGRKATSCPRWTGFGLGWQLLGFPGETTMLHTGKDAGAFTFAAINRASGDGVVILTNSDNGWRVILPILESTGSDPKLIAFLRSQMN
ncbi:CubicO group peptidase, beta-lactamase class C family [Sphingobium sp. AP50]|uniref:serine hydrolase domain-containing protein n=1 Tax=Sphingobium sp. AP50 TaxID=1884369 RepID=UPI0008AE958A|nr:serine hydrolase domain-containing protein [Sphingobium sp. AP50]SEK01018.1 CubicO group peptidase, beta-lactamase class C family [Sphingobium sp. AP50]